MDVVWIRPTTSPNGGDSYLVFCYTLRKFSLFIFPEITWPFSSSKHRIWIEFAARSFEKMFQLTLVSATIGPWMGHYGDLFLTNEARILKKCPAEMCSENGEKYWNKEVLYVFWCLWEQNFYDFWSFFKVLHHRERASACLYFVVIQPFRWFVKLKCSSCSSCSSFFWWFRSPICHFFYYITIYILIIYIIIKEENCRF